MKSRKPDSIFTSLLCLLLCATLSATDFIDKIHDDTRELCRSQSRITGSPGSREAAEFIKESLADLPNVELLSHPFSLFMPKYREASMVVSEGEFAGSHDIYPVWPDSVRLKTTPITGISGQPVYCGQAEIDELPAKSLDGQIAVIEMSAYRNWKNVLRMGATAVLLLGGERDQAIMPEEQPIYHPRFYVQNPALIKALRDNLIPRVKLNAIGDWQEVEAENIYALVKGRQPFDKIRPLIISVQYDAMSLIPQLAPGANNAANAAFIINMIRYYSRFQPERSVVFAFTDAVSINNRGILEMLAMLAITPDDKTRNAYLKMEQELADEYAEIHQLVHQFEDDLQAINTINDKKKYKEIQRYCKDALSPAIIKNKERSGQLRLLMAKTEDQEKRNRLNKDLEEIIGRISTLNQTLFQLVTKAPFTPEIETEALAVWNEVKRRIDSQHATQQQRLLWFEENDRRRQDFFARFGFENPDINPFQYLISINLSDSGIVVGPALYCSHSTFNESETARDFTRWLKEAIRFREEKFAAIAREKLLAIGIGNTGLENLVQRVIHRDELEPSKLAAIISEEFPNIDAETVSGLAKAFRQMESPDPAGIRDILIRLVPGMDNSRAGTLSQAIMNLQAIEGAGEPESFTLGPQLLPSTATRSFGMKGVTWATLEGISNKTDTPNDSFENLVWERLDPQITVTALLLEIIVNDPAFQPEIQKASGFPAWRIPHGSIVSESVAETIARTPMPGFVTTLTTISNWDPRNRVPGIRAQEFVTTAADGTFRFPIQSGPSGAPWYEQRRRLQSYKIDEEGKITYGLSDNTSMLAGTMNSIFFLRDRPPLNPARQLAFECVELNGPVMFDPRYQESLSTYTLIDVVRGGTPKRAQFNMFRGQAFGLLTPDTRWQLIMRSGQRRNRMVLMNVNPELNEREMALGDAIKTGFPATRDIPALPELQSAKDLLAIDEWRINRLENAGISLPAIKQIHEQTKLLIKDTEEAYHEDRGGAMIRSAMSALANELRAYHAIQKQADDVTRGAIFLLILLVPFSIAMERLLIASVRIGHQIIFGNLIFLLMLGILWSFHPGFKITAQPLIILMSFIILLLSMTVIIMVLQKFKSSLEELKKGASAEASGAQTNRGGVIVSAAWLGIANMRKRLLRTILTAATIVIITFSLLCFTSSSTFQDKRVFSLDNSAAGKFSGLMTQHPSYRSIRDKAVSNVRLLLGDQYPVCGRYWLISSRNPAWRFHLRNSQTNKMVSLKAALLLNGLEKKLSRPQDILANWEEFEEGNGCYLSESNAKALGVSPGDWLLAGGQEFKLLDTYDSLELEKRLKKIDGQSLLPIDYTVEREDYAMDQEAVEGQIASGESLQPDPTVVFCSGNDIVILPDSFRHSVDASLRSIAAAIPPEKVKSAAEKLMHILVYPIYYSDQQEVKAIVSTPLIPKAPRKILIPMLIAALIIFNTMLNSVAERKGEIHVYTSLGLAPAHVGMLFLAEAVTYGLMGSVFGYIVGQGLATVLTNLNLMGGITLNYSGTNVMMTMGLVLSVVVCSAIVPAVMAAKVANPNKDADWKVPKPQNDVIRDLLPFTVTRNAAKGLLCFISEFMDAHRDGAIGNFTSDNIAYHGSEGDSSVGLSGTFWLAPYDLGVRQRVKIEIVPEMENICMIRIILTREAGQERSWWRLNKVFLADLRRQFLGWRNISRERVMDYIEKGEKAVT